MHSWSFNFSHKNTFEIIAAFEWFIYYFIIYHKPRLVSYTVTSNFYGEHFTWGNNIIRLTDLPLWNLLSGRYIINELTPRKNLCPSSCICFRLNLACPHHCLSPCVHMIAMELLIYSLSKKNSFSLFMISSCDSSLGMTTSSKLDNKSTW